MIFVYKYGYKVVVQEKKDVLNRVRERQRVYREEEKETMKKE